MWRRDPTVKIALISFTCYFGFKMSGPLRNDQVKDMRTEQGHYRFSTGAMIKNFKSGLYTFPETFAPIFFLPIGIFVSFKVLKKT